jgi:hypothetical protein
MNCFVIMPFSPDFAEVYENIRLAVEGAVATEPINCFRLDELKAAGRISERLVRQLADAGVCVADVSGLNPNVMWEVGYAMALDKPTLLISQERDSLPFDLQDMQTVFYKRDDLPATLRDPLGAAVRHTLAEYGVRARSRRSLLPEKTKFTIAITGSKQAHQERVRRELDDLIRPYLTQSVNWLVGSWGMTDETAIELLVEHRQRPWVVGHDEFDISPRALELVEKHGLSFVSASSEQLPRKIEGARPRDVLFLWQANLVFLLWSGKSNRIKALMRLYREQRKHHVIGFV